MNEKRLLELFDYVDEKYIEEAFPENVKKHSFQFRKVIAAACLCLLLGAGVFWKTSAEAKYYHTNMDEVMAIYEGELLAQKLSYEGARDTEVLLCYTGNELPLSSDEKWKTLSVSASYEDYDMTLNCAFDGESFHGDKAQVADTLWYGDTLIQIYQEESDNEFEQIYYAVFEYENVCYELTTYSNDKECIYEILQAVLGGQ